MKVLLIGFAACLVPALAQTDGPLKQVQTLPLANISGSLGHLSVDVKGERLFVAATDANAVEVFDLRRGALLNSVTGFDKPLDVLFVPGSGSGQVFVSGADGKLRSFDAGTSQAAKTIDLGAAVGQLRYDPSAKRIYAAVGDAGLAVIDPAAGAKVGEVKLAGRAESFELEKTGSRIFVNVPGAKEIAVIDRKTPGNPANIPVAWAEENYTMTLDEANHRLLVVTRKPVKMLVLNTVTSQWVTELPFPDVPRGDEVDNLFYDAARKRVYIVSGSSIVPPNHVGVVYAVDQFDADHYVVKQKAVTALEARTGLFVPELQRFFVALPATGHSAAEVRAYETK